MRPTLHALRARAQELRYAFLVIPVMMTTGLLLLALVLVWVDSRGGDGGRGLAFAQDASTARTLLNTIATAVAAVAGITFSIAIVALQLVSQQFSPRALRGFLGDRLSQMIAGLFTGTVLYCLAALRFVRSDSEPFVPSLTVTGAALLGVASILALLVFVSHISQRVQVSRIAGDIAQIALSELPQLYPKPFGEPDPDADPERLVAEWESGNRPHRIYPPRPGYVQSVALDDLPKRIGGSGSRIHVKVAPGDFVALDEPLAEIWDAEAPLEDVERELRRAIPVRHERDTAQDYQYAVRQLADIAIKAVSPSINDPTTAWTCVSYIGVLLERLVRRGLPARVLRYPNDVVVVVRRHGLPEYAAVAFLEVGRHGARDARVSWRVLEEIARVARAASDDGDRRLLLECAEAVAEAALERAETEPDRRELERALAGARSAAAVESVTRRPR